MKGEETLPFTFSPLFTLKGRETSRLYCELFFTFKRFLNF